MYICMYVCVQKSVLSAGSSPERLVEALSRTLQTNASGPLKSSEALSTLDNPALSTTLSITELTIYGELGLELIHLMMPYTYSTI